MTDWLGIEEQLGRALVAYGRLTLSAQTCVAFLLSGPARTSGLVVASRLGDSALFDILCALTSAKYPGDAAAYASWRGRLAKIEQRRNNVVHSAYVPAWDGQPSNDKPPVGVRRIKFRT